MSEVLSFVFLLLVIAIMGVVLNFTFKPSYIFGFILFWQGIQLFLLYIEQQRKKRLPQKATDNSDNTDQNKTATNSTNTASLQHSDDTLVALEQRLSAERDAWQRKQHKVTFPVQQLKISPTAGHIEVAVLASRAIEEILEQQFGAYGKGLHSKLNSVEEKIPSHIVSKIRWVATVRNNTVHTTSASFEKNDLLRTSQDIIAYLQNT